MDKGAVRLGSISLLGIAVCLWTATPIAAQNPTPNPNTSSLAAKSDPRASGAFKTTSSGSASYTVPISVPPGTAGMAPNIALAYDSRAENDLLGMGWSLSGLSSVHRCPATVAQDGFQGGINYDSNDRFCLDGQRLMAVSGVYGGDGTEYRTEIDSSVKVISYGVAGSGPASFRVWNKAGQLMEFGNTTDSRIEAQGKASVRVWALNKIQDTSGNYLTVSYFEDNANGEYRPTRVDYTGNTAGGLTPNRSVQFSYAARPDVVPQFEGGSLVKTTVRLTNVQTYVGTTLVRDYRLTYEIGTATGRSRLNTMTECAGDGSCLPATTFGWQEGGSGFAAPQGWGTYSCCGSYDLGDFNADGKTDLVYVDVGTIKVYLSTGSSLAAPQLWGNFSGNGSYQIADFNGDGKTDFIYVDNGNFSVYLSTGSGFAAPQVWGGYSCCGTYRLADFNGDGKADLIYVDGGRLSVYLSTGSSFAAPQLWGNYSGNGSYQFADFNGDGKTDLVYVDNGNFSLYLSTGSAFSAAQVWGSYSCCGTYRLADFNGDGKTDLIYVDGGRLSVYLSTGSSFVAPQLWGNYSGNGSYQFADFNGDGKTDLVYVDSFNMLVYLSTGSGFATPVVWGNYSGNGTYQLGDFNGDGKIDLVYVNALLFNVYLVNSPFPDLITSITNSIGGQTTISYKPITDSAVYAKDNDAVYPVMDLQTSLYVVASQTASDGRGGNYTSTFRYGGLKTHLQGRGGLGFRWMRVVENASGLENTSFFNQNFPFTGSPSVSETRNSSGALFTQVAHTYLTANPFPSVTFVAPSRVDNFKCDGQPTCLQTAQTFTYDSFGNPTRVFHLGDVPAPGDERDERTDWSVDTANWIHRPSRTALLDANGALLREKWLSYDARGLLTREEVRLTGPQGSVGNPVVTHSYDAFGNQTSSTDPRGCTTSTTYDSTQSFPATITTCLGNTISFQYDVGLGVVTSHTDPNGQTATSTYDSFGRLTRVTGPLDTASTYGSMSRFYLDIGNPSAQRVQTFRTEQHGTANVIWSEEYFDGLGRSYLTRSEGPGGQIIQSETTFDSRGLVAAKSAPHFSTEPAVWTQFAYDTLGRQTQVFHADGTVATTSYVQDVVTHTDERGNVKHRFLDAYGQLEEVREINGTETYRTFYQYDAAGSLIRVTNHFGHVTTTSYDILGRKIAMSDPNMGVWNYSYDIGGNLLSQTDAKGQTLTFTYDLQSRPLTKRYPNNQQITWTYDDPAVAFSRGRLTRVTDLAATTSFTYDQLGRTIQTQRTIDGVTYTMSQSQDALGRIVSETFPDNETVTYSYNEAGWLASIPGYVTNINYNARGQRTQLQYANGITSAWSYNAQNFRMTNQATSGVNGTFQNLSYGYDNTGNITSITDAVFTGSRSFAYDALNRLTQATGNFGSSQSLVTHNYRYDAIGNILEKGGVVYSYTDPLHPSAVTSTSDGKTYTYDANGNILTGGNRSQTWGADNRLATMTNPSGSLSFAYDHTGIRLKKTSSSGITYFPFSGYQIEPNGVITKYIRIGLDNVASKKSTGEKLFHHNDHLGGVNVTTNTSGLMAQVIEYDPWGKVSREEGTGESLRRFTGKQLDPESGLYYYNARYYDPELGRFISADTIVPRPDDPQSLNRYSYADNDPVNKIDPTGHLSFKRFWKKLWGLKRSIFRGGEEFKQAWKSYWAETRKAWKEILQSPFGRIYLAGIFAVGSYGAFSWVSGAVFSQTVAAVTGLAAASTQAIMEIPPVQRFFARAGTGASIAAHLVFNAMFQNLYGSLATEPTTIIKTADATPEQLAKAAEIVKSGGGTCFKPCVQTLGDVSKLVLSRGNVVGVVGAENTAILGLIPGQHSAALFGNLTTRSEILWSPHNLYGIWGTSHQALSVTFLQAGYGGTILNAGIGDLRGVTSLLYGPYGGGAIFNPAFNPKLYGKD